MPMPEFIPDDLPESILFVVAGIDPGALAADEIPPLGPLDRARSAHPVGCAVQMAINCDPGLVVAALRALAATIEADLHEVRARRN